VVPPSPRSTTWDPFGLVPDRMNLASLHGTPMRLDKKYSTVLSVIQGETSRPARFLCIGNRRGDCVYEAGSALKSPVRRGTGWGLDRTEPGAPIEGLVAGCGIGSGRHPARRMQPVVESGLLIPWWDAA
jgi:hypothetical protein